MIVPGLNDLTYKILLSLREGRGELYYPYKHLEADTGYSRAEIKKSLDVLKKIGIVNYARGLMTEEGEVAGSGFGIPWGDAYTAAELAIYRYKFGELEKPMFIPQFPDRIVVGSETYQRVSDLKPSDSEATEGLSKSQSSGTREEQ